MSARLLCVALVMSGALAAAADLPVRYTVDDKMLKDAVAGTTVTFELYTDPSCSGSPVHSQSVAVENVDVVSRLKRFKASKSSKPPATAELSQTLTGVSASGNLYLKVTGTGVTAVGGSCQPQAATLQLPPGLSLVVKDANGAVVGLPFGPYGTHSTSGYSVRVGGRVVYVAGNNQSGFTSRSSARGVLGTLMQFVSSDCSGQAMAFADPSVIPVGVYRATTGLVYAPPETGSTVTINSSLVWDDSGYENSTCVGFGRTPIGSDACCYLSGDLGYYGPVLTKDVSTLTPPFHVE